MAVGPGQARPGRPGRRAAILGPDIAAHHVAIAVRRQGKGTPTYYRVMRLRPMLQVRDVAQSSSWYHDVLGLVSGHGGDEYDMLFSGDEFVLQLHREEAGEHRIPGGEPGAGS